MRFNPRYTDRLFSSGFTVSQYTFDQQTRTRMGTLHVLSAVRSRLRDSGWRMRVVVIIQNSEACICEPGENLNLYPTAFCVA